MIEITEYKYIGKGALQGSFTVKIVPFANMLIRRCKHFIKGENAWIHLPGEEYEKDGKKKTFYHVSFENLNTATEFQNKIMDALKTYLEKNPQSVKSEFDDLQSMNFLSDPQVVPPQENPPF